jgi:hypothetical protein
MKPSRTSPNRTGFRLMQTEQETVEIDEEGIAVVRGQLPTIDELRQQEADDYTIRLIYPQG